MKFLMLKNRGKLNLLQKVCMYFVFIHWPLLLEEDSAIKQWTTSSVRPSNSIQDARE